MIHWNQKRTLKKQFAQLFAVMAIILTLIVIDSRALTGEVDLSHLGILHRYDLPVRELSGLSSVMSPSGSAEPMLIGVGDTNGQLAHFRLEGDKVVARELDMTSAILRKFSACRFVMEGACRKINKALASDWEGVALDSAGKMALLQEFSSSVVFVDFLAGKAVSRVHLDFEGAGFTSASKKSQMAEKTLGEGILLLKNGHILVAKERHPAAIIEFGPATHRAIGGSKEALLFKEPFLMPKEDTEYKALHVWQRRPGSKCDISDLSVDESGAIYVLSENCRRIVLYKDGLSKSTNRLDSKKGWVIPKKVKNPEALSVLKEGFLIGSDIKSKKANLFLVEKKPSRSF